MKQALVGQGMYTRQENSHLEWPDHTVCVSLYITVDGALKARTLKWFAIPFSSGPRFFRTLHRDLSVLGGPIWHGS